MRLADVGEVEQAADELQAVIRAWCRSRQQPRTSDGAGNLLAGPAPAAPTGEGPGREER